MKVFRDALSCLILTNSQTDMQSVSQQH